MPRRVDPERFLSGLHPEHFEALRRLMRPMEFAHGEHLCRQGEPATRAWLIDEGQVELHVRVPGGADTDLARVRSGELLGELGLLIDARRTAHARAQGRVRALAIESQAFRSLLAYHHAAGLGLLRGLLALIAARAHRAMELIEALEAIPRSESRLEPWVMSDGDRGARFVYRPFLEQLPIVSSFDARDLSQLIELSAELTLSRGTLLWQEGDAPGSCFLVVRGAVELRLGRSPLARSLGVVGPGGIIGLDGILTGRAHVCDALVREPALLLAIRAEQIGALLGDDHRLAFHLLHGAAPQLARWLEHLNLVVMHLESQRRRAGLPARVASQPSERATILDASKPGPRP